MDLFYGPQPHNTSRNPSVILLNEKKNREQEGFGGVEIKSSVLDI